MRSKLAAAMIAISMLGAGCVQPITKSNSTAEPLGAPSPEGYVDFRNGFGALPGPAPSALVPLAAPQLTWSIEPPQMITEATVLRREPTLPTPSFLENITNALHIPGGALLAGPTALRAQVDWKDKDGYLWTFDAETNRLTFALPDKNTPLTTSVLPADEAVTAAADSFVRDRSLADRSWGKASLAFSWNAWWANEKTLQHCMSAASLEAIRTIAAHPGSWPDLPRLPASTSGACASPEFPSRQTIRFQMTQDDQLVYDETGSGDAIAEIVVRTDTMKVESGMIELAKELDRSNYPVKTQSQALRELRLGGIRGSEGLAAGDRVTITEFSFALYRHDAAQNGALRTYFIPSLVANGTIAYASGGTAPYATLVPLVSDESYK
jgi:hypothetical protein